MPHFGTRSQARLATVDSRLQAVLGIVIVHYDFTIICGHRTEDEQQAAFEGGFSMTPWPHSKHNRWPSAAVDIAPWPVDWNDKESFYYLAGRVMQVADEMGIRVRWGGDWDMDDDLHDQSFMDLGHFELANVEEPRILYADTGAEARETWSAGRIVV